MRSKAAGYWTDSASFATTLFVLYADAFGTEGFAWDADTVAMEIEAEFGVKPADANLGRLYTAVWLATTDEFYRSLPDFIQACVVLSGGTVMPGVWQPADALEVAWGVTESLLIWPPDGDEPFTTEIRKYVGKVCEREGLVNPPDVLRVGITDRAVALGGDAAEMNALKCDEIVDNLRDSLGRLADQLESLPLEHGSASDLVARVRRNLKTKG